MEVDAVAKGGKKGQGKGSGFEKGGGKKGGKSGKNGKGSWTSPPTIDERTCWVSGKPGHMAKDCRNQSHASSGT